MKEEMKEEHRVEEQNTSEIVSVESDLRPAIELISYLISITHSIKIFPVKWQSIRNKLEQLYSSLVATENCNSVENSPLSALVSSIVSTVNDCSDLARRCVDLSYSGKLLMQSDLDVVAAKFDQHIKKLNGIYAAGILTNGYAIVVSRPSAGASPDDMKFYVRDLFTRLRLGDSGMKNQALIGLNEILCEDEKYVRIVVDLPEIISLLTSFLEFAEAEIQEQSAEAISALASFASCRGFLIGTGVIAPLIQVLDIGSAAAKEKAARALQKLTQNSDNAWSVSAHGGVTILLKICSNGNSSGELMSSACCVLRNLAGVDEIKKFMVEEGAISTFVRLTKSKEEVVQIRAAEFLQVMACGDETIRLMVVREGGIQSFVRILDPKSSFSSKTREIALQAIERFCFFSMNCVNILVSLGFLDHLLFILRNGEASVQESAVKVVFRLCGSSEDIKKSMGDLGFMPELVKLLNSKSFEVREMAAEALSSMVSIPRNRRKFVQDDSNIVRVLQLLDPEEEKSGNNKYLLSTLMSLTNSNSARKKIAASGYVKYLERLAETEVVEAKKIVRKVSENRFRRVLSGILHS